MYFIVIFREILHKEGTEKEWWKFGQNPLDLVQRQRLADNDFKESLFFDFEIREISE